jgi:ABC-type oligopeptide transport system substrate-binding subunit
MKTRLAIAALVTALACAPFAAEAKTPQNSTTASKMYPTSVFNPPGFSYPTSVLNPPSFSYPTSVLNK